MEYTDEEQDQLIAEIEALPEGTLIEEALADFFVMREQSRHCQ